MYKTTKCDFAEFKKEAEFWIGYFGLKEWEVSYTHEDIDNGYAKSNASYQTKIATITLDIVLPDKRKVKLYAFHEVCELMFTQVSDFITGTFSGYERNQSVHNIIIRLQNTIFLQKRGKQ